MNYFAYPAEPVRVSARLSELEYGKSQTEIVNDPYVESMVIEYSDGSSGFISQGVGMELQIFCDRGTLLVGADAEEVVFRTTDQADPYLRVSNEVELDLNDLEGIAAPIDTLYKALLLEEESLKDAAQSIDSAVSGMKVVFTAVESHIRGGAFVSVGDYPEDIYMHGRFGNKLA